MSTQSFKVLQLFGLDGSSWKILVQARSGNRYFVWYDTGIEAKVGEEVLITIDGDYWRKINNPRNGRDSDITRYNKIS